MWKNFKTLKNMKKDNKINLKKILAITWIDVVESNTEWQSLEDTIDWIKKSKCLVKQVGFLVHEDSNYISMCCQINNIGEDFNCGNTTKIPKGWIKEIKEIEI
jgi:hypothetical protein